MLHNIEKNLLLNSTISCAILEKTRTRGFLKDFTRACFSQIALEVILYLDHTIRIGSTPTFLY